MSSHHFVKEGQEPALLIFDAISFEYAEPLLEWAPFVLVTERALDAVLDWGIKVDAVLLEQADEAVVAEKIAGQAPVAQIPFTEGKDLLEAGFQYLIGQRQKAVNVLAHLSDTFFTEGQRLAPQLQVTLIDDKTKWSVVSTGHYEKWLPRHASIRIRKSEASQELHCQGLVQQGSLAEAASDGLIRVVSSGIFWIGESL
jgi:hypothetical protein